MARTRPPLVGRRAIGVLALLIVCGWCSFAAAATCGAGNDAALRAAIAHFNDVRPVFFTSDLTFTRDLDSSCPPVSPPGAALKSCSATGASSLITRAEMMIRPPDSRRQLRRAGFTARAERLALTPQPDRAHGEPRRAHGQREFRQADFGNRLSRHLRFR